MVNDVFNLAGDQKMNQVKIRHRLYQAIDKLRKMGTEPSLLALLTLIAQNPYAIHEVKLPHHPGA